MPLFRLGALLLLLADGSSSPSLLDRCRYPVRPDTTWALPHALAEVSGLAYLPGRGLLAHNDERGALFLLDPATGRVLGTWPLQGRPADDFEGIAVAGGAVFLQSSTGRIYRMAIPQGSPQPLRYQVVDSGLAGECELEGSAYDPAARVLLLPCKTVRRRAKDVALRIFRWDAVDGRLAEPAWVEVSSRALGRVSPWASFNASAIEVVPGGDHLLVLSSRQLGLVELTFDGAVVGTKRLDGRSHRQPEGLTLTSKGDLLISDESRGAHATLSLYRCRA